MTLWAADHSLILASQSKSRQALLKGAGLAFETVPADLDERTLQDQSGKKHPSEIAALLALEKARSVASRRQGNIVIGADQTLALGAELFAKPNDRAGAAGQLRRLSGRTHELHSAIAVVRNNETLFEHVSIARMTMRNLTDQAIETYLDAAGGAVTTTVGAYQLEALGVHLFERIEGDHFTILGLPLLPLLGYLRSAGLVKI